VTPRPVGESATDEPLFWKRYKQIKALLSAGQKLRRWKFDREEALSQVNYLLPLVVLDGLNMLTGAPLTREEMHQLFRLFRRHETIGLLVTESSQSSPFDSTMADVVISLASKEDCGYLLQHLEIEKSRYMGQVRGRHPFKILPLGTEIGTEKASLYTPMVPKKDKRAPLRRHGLVVYPSLHYVMVKTGYEPGLAAARSHATATFSTGDRYVDQLGLPANLPRTSVVTIEGPRGTFKSALANTFLISGLLERQSVLLIRFNDEPYYDLSDRWPRLSASLLDKVSSNAGSFTWRDFKLIPDEGKKESGSWVNLASEHKVSISRWEYKPSEAHAGQDGPALFEVDFKSGALLPEEFVHVIREIMIRAEEISRVAVQDVDMIGVSYPFLKHSETTGDLFLTAFTHIMRNSQVGLLMTATRSGLAEANAMVDRAVVLSDAALSTEYCDIFGKREVVLRPRGVAGRLEGKDEPRAKGEAPLREVTPLLLRPYDGGDSVPQFVVDTRCLDGFVGFGTQQIHRAGVSIFLFEENDGPHRRYNDDVESMVCAAMARPSRGLFRSRMPARASQQVSVLRFGSLFSEAVHKSLGILPGGSPLERTVVYTVDEFWEEDIHEPDRLLSFKPYYRNILLLAYLREAVTEVQPKGNPGPLSFGSWQEVAGFAKEYSDGAGQGRRGFWCDLSASETLSCVLMDALASGKGLQYADGEENKIFESKDSRLSCGQLNALEALCDLFSMTGPIEESQMRLLPTDACVYVCWYSQLRELIAREPRLGEQLDVAALPGGGFKGDWFIGIEKGSVSIALGEIIVRKLTDPAEDYRRFAAGVGLPASNKFEDPDDRVFAWPRAQHVTLARIIKDIYGNAWSRSKIPQYPQFRTALSTICRHLTPLAGDALGDKRPDRRKMVRTLVERVLRRVPLLKSVSTEGSGQSGNSGIV